MQIIHRLTVVSNPTRVFEVGTEIEGREVIEIKQIGSDFEDHVHSEFYVLDENGHLIASIENAPVIVEYRQIAEHDAEDVTELKAVAGTTALINREIKLLELRKYRAEKLITDPQLRQQLLTALEAQRCSLQSSLQRL